MRKTLQYGWPALAFAALLAFAVAGALLRADSHSPPAPWAVAAGSASSHPALDRLNAINRELAPLADAQARGVPIPRATIDDANLRVMRGMADALQESERRH